MNLKQVENFFPRLDHLLPEFKKIKLYNQEEYSRKFKKAEWPGLRSQHLINENVFLYELINTLLFQHKLLEKGRWEIHSFLHLRLNEDRGKDWIHQDREDFAGIIYLSETKFDSGTYLYDENKNLINNIVGVKNRAIVYDAKLNHMGYGHYGSNVHDGRLTLNIFINNHDVNKK